VGVSSSGNHDNNIYNQNWSESNHGLKVVRPGRTLANANGGRGNVTQAGRRSGAGPGASNAANGENGSNVSNGAIADSITYVDDSLKYEIKVPTNIELAPNLKGNLLLVTGDMDNNVHPGNTIRLVNALIKANKRFDFMLMPGKPHGYGDMQPYFTHMLMEYFAEHLIGDYYRGGAEIK
jgi:hypothetical protein